MTYAYPPEGYGEVDIEANVDDDWLRFIISDKGIPFDPTAKEDVDTSLSAEERQIGGLGIHLVRTIMDNISYERRDHQNVLTLGKKLNVANV
jgi:anti-sigma regulatory factor (Ser/Thr protein kinase)